MTRFQLVRFLLEIREDSDKYQKLFRDKELREPLHEYELLRLPKKYLAELAGMYISDELAEMNRASLLKGDNKTPFSAKELETPLIVQSCREAAERLSVNLHFLRESKKLSPLQKAEYELETLHSLKEVWKSLVI